LTGLTTGVVNAGADFELELNLRDNQLNAWMSDGAKFVEDLHGQPTSEFAKRINDFLIAGGVDDQLVPKAGEYNEQPESGAWFVYP
jgi:hypothetical protein